MNGPPVNSALKLSARDRVVVHPDSRAARWIGALAMLSLVFWIAVLHHDPAWSLTILAAVALITRGVFLNLPVTAARVWVAVTLLVIGLAAEVLMLDPVGGLLIAGSAAALVWPTTARPNPAELPKIWTLVDATTGDPLAPFAMQPRKCYHFTADGRAAIAYRTRLGYAVVSGDPIGDATQFRSLVADFAAMCHARGWRIVVLGCSERRVALWSDAALVGRSLRAVPIGRDVVVDVTSFAMTGRKFRNLRQAVQRTRNAGITTEVVDESDIPPPLLDELTELLLSSQKGARTERGFSMSIDGALEGRYPGIHLIVARDADGRLQGFHRYATAGGGSEVSLDVPWRRRGAPNGIDERLSVDMIQWASEHGGTRMSLAFAAFPEIFKDTNRGWIASLVYTAIHLGDPLIALESLYRYLRKFHALGDRRYVMASLTQVLPLLVVLLSLEFVPRRRRL